MRTDPRLTRRETEVLGWIVAGLQTRQIAFEMDVADKTVIAHRTNLMRKLGIHSRTELICWANGG